jgi:hypothetical protein
MKAINKKTNRFDWSEVIALNYSYRAGSLSRVLDYLNTTDVLEFFERSNRPFTIPELKALCPEYLAPKYDKNGKVIERKYEPFKFMVAYRNLNG